jgi:RraA family protein
VEPQPYATADVSDAAGGLVAMHPRIRPAWHGARVVGPAFTVRTPPGQHPAVRQALERAAPGDVIVIDGGASTERALWGDKLSARALERGIAGVVIDGALRDVAAVEELGFPIFAIASVPTRPETDVEGELAVAIVCGGIAVEPGDLVVGDADGVVVVPRAAATDVLARLAAG